MCDRNKLAAIAREETPKPYNGKWNHCVILAGFKIPVRPNESSCSLAGCVAWEEGA